MSIEYDKEYDGWMVIESCVVCKFLSLVIAIVADSLSINK